MFNQVKEWFLTIFCEALLDSVGIILEEACPAGVAFFGGNRARIEMVAYCYSQSVGRIEVFSWKFFQFK